MTKRYMRIDEVAEMFGVHVRTVKRWWESGKTCLVAWHPTHRICRGLLFSAESVRQFEATGQIFPENWIEDPEVKVNIEKTQDVVPKKRKTTK